MKFWAKAGLIGFIVAFLGLWIALFLTGHDQYGWKCAYASGPDYCSFSKFIFAPLHWAFVLFLSWIGFFAGVIDARIINKIIEKHANDRTVYLRIAFTITLTLIILFGIVGIIAFPDGIEVFIYCIIFIFVAIIASRIIAKKKYGR